MTARYENQAPGATRLCRNGPQCRKNHEGTCPYNHDFGSMPMATNGALSIAKKILNVESPSFTPDPGLAPPVKRLGISPGAAAAPSFTPRGSGSITPARGFHSKEPSDEFVPNQPFQSPQHFTTFVPSQDFVPQQPLFEPQQSIQPTLTDYHDPFLSPPSLVHALSGFVDGSQQSVNPYAQTPQPASGQAFYSEQSSYKHPLNYHLYASIGPRRDNLLPYQRSASDFFLPDELREDLQRKSEATLQTYANSTLPQIVAHYHSLVALDTHNQKGPSTFDYPSSVYKAVSSNDGLTYVLRRLEGFKLDPKNPITNIVNSWKRVNNASFVRFHEAFTDTNKFFAGNSLFVVTDYHPLAQTLADKQFPTGRQIGSSRGSSQIVPENDLWGYIVQLASALKGIHEAGLAAQTVLASKVLITSKNRVRLNGCGVLDIVRYEQQRPVHELQRADLEDLGKLLLSLALRNPNAPSTLEKCLPLLAHSPYSDRFKSCLLWLLSPAAQPSDPSTDYNITNLLTNLADKLISSLDSSLHLADDLTSSLARELENGRLVRLLAKLNVILERPDINATVPQLPSSSLLTTTNPNLANPSNPSNPNPLSSAHLYLNQPSPAWSETGERYHLKLFRDYVFHQVDAEGRPVLDLGHILACLNKLDAGSEERIQLVSRDEQNVLVLSYREVKRGFEAAWAEIGKAAVAGGGRR